MAKKDTKTFLLIALTGGLAAWWYSRLPRIKVVATQPGGGITYKMSINGFSITDTYVIGDEPQFIPTGDGTHYFACVAGSFNTATLSIGYYTADGGFKGIKTEVISW